MAAERAGYTVTMFLVDVSPSTGKLRQVELKDSKGETRMVEMTNLQYSLQYAKLKIKEMIYGGRKTDQCGVILFGTEETINIVNKENGDYEFITEYIPIAQPTAETIAKLNALEPSTQIGDSLGALVVGIDTQERYLKNKSNWSRKIVLLTDGENPLEIDKWEDIVKKLNMNKIKLAIIGDDFDCYEPDMLFNEETKSHIKAENEKFYAKFIEGVNDGAIGNTTFAIGETSRPDVKGTRSALMDQILRLGDPYPSNEERYAQAIEINVKSAKATAIARPKGWKKFAKREDDDEDVSILDSEEEAKAVYAQLQMRTEYYIDRGNDDDSEDEDEEMKDKDPESLEKLDKEELQRGYKYGSSYVPEPEDGLEKLEGSKKGIDILGFFPRKLFRRELAMGEVQYVVGPPKNQRSQVMLSSIVQAMYEKGVMAITRWVGRDGADPKMGVLEPMVLPELECFLWVQMPFADDIRKYTFPSLERLVSVKGEVLTKHPYLPTESQMTAMENFVDVMDLMEADKDEEGNRQPWFDALYSYNPALHRIKQAQIHAMFVDDLNTDPLPPPNPELTKYFNPPRRVLKYAREAIEDAKKTFKVKEVPKKVLRVRKDGHVNAQDEDDDEELLLDRLPRNSQAQSQRTQITQTQHTSPRTQRTAIKTRNADDGSETEAESGDEELLLDQKQHSRGGNLASTAMDPKREPGRIIGHSYPLADFKKNIAVGDLVTKAVEDLAYVVTDIVTRPFASRRTNEMIECLQVLRKTCLEEDEIDAWNEFLPELKKICVEKKPGNKEFWSQFTELGPDYSLITRPEAASAGGRSSILLAQAAEFIRLPN